MTTNTLIVGCGTLWCHAGQCRVPVSFHMTDCWTWPEYITAHQGSCDIHVSSSPHKYVFFSALECMVASDGLMAATRKVIFDVEPSIAQTIYPAFKHHERTWQSVLVCRVHGQSMIFWLQHLVGFMLPIHVLHVSGWAVLLPLFLSLGLPTDIDWMFRKHGG